MKNFCDGKRLIWAYIVPYCIFDTKVSIDLIDSPGKRDAGNLTDSQETATQGLLDNQQHEYHQSSSNTAMFKAFFPFDKLRLKRLTVILLLRNFHNGRRIQSEHADVQQ